MVLVRTASMGKIFSRRHFNIFLFFHEKQILAFHANCNQLGQFKWKYEILFSSKNKKKIINFSPAKQAQRVVKVKWRKVYRSTSYQSEKIIFFLRKWPVQFVSVLLLFSLFRYNNNNNNNKLSVFTRVEMCYICRFDELPCYHRWEHTSTLLW